MKVAFLHEFTHALLHPFTGNASANFYYDKVNEPVTEYGMLCFCQAIRDNNMLNYALKNVQDKQDCPPICHYGLGYYLFMREALDCKFPVGNILKNIYKQKIHYAKKLSSSINSNITIPLYSFEDKFRETFLQNDYPIKDQDTLYKCLVKGSRFHSMSYPFSLTVKVV